MINRRSRATISRSSVSATPWSIASRRMGRTRPAILGQTWSTSAGLGRCRRNAQILTGAPAGASGVWAVVAWFIPVLNWWLPRQFVLDIENASAGVSQNGEQGGFGERLVRVWVAHLVVGAVALTARQGPTIPFVVVAETLTIGAAVMAICVIEHLTRLQGAALGAVAHVEPLTQA
ncbi:DUF4328 domain-containing protein [Streptomyces sp. NPDC003758]